MLTGDGLAFGVRCTRAQEDRRSLEQVAGLSTEQQGLTIGHGDIIRGLRRRLPDIDLARAQDSLPEGTPDPEVLTWAAAENRILITNDRNTMIKFAYQRVAADEPVPGLIATTNEQAIGLAIDDILLVAECMSEQEIRKQVVVFLPIRG